MVQLPHGGGQLADENALPTACLPHDEDRELRHDRAAETLQVQLRGLRLHEQRDEALKVGRGQEVSIDLNNMRTVISRDLHYSPSLKIIARKDVSGSRFHRKIEKILHLILVVSHDALQERQRDDVEEF